MSEQHTVTCPRCHVILPAGEIESGWCENCGKKLPPTILSWWAYGREDAMTREPESVACLKAVRNADSSASNSGGLIGAVVGGLIYVLLMVGPLHAAGYLITFAAGLFIVTVTIGIGRAAGATMSRAHD